MKSTFTLIIAIVAIAANAQLIPNANFENWTSNTWTNTPDNWQTDNSQVLEPVTQDLDAYEGDYAMKVTSQSADIGEYAIAFTTFDIDYIPASLDFYVKTEIEFGAVSVSIFFYNQENVVASHDWFSSETYEEWTPISIEMDQIEPIITHAKIHVLTEVGDFVAGDAIISIDAMGFGTISGVDKIQNRNLAIYPNPANDILTINGSANTFDFVSIYDISGKILLEESITSLSNQVDVSDLPLGAYTVIASSETGERASQKLLIVR